MSGNGAEFDRLLTEAGLTPEAYARRLNDSAEHHGFHKRLHLKTPYKWRCGQVPGRPWSALAAHLLSDLLGRTITPSDLGWPDDSGEAVPASTGLVLPWTVAGALHAVQTVNEGGIMRRRTFVTLLGSAMTASGHEWLIAGPAGSPIATRGYQLTTDVVDHIDAITADLRRMDDHLGGGQTLGLVRQHLSTVTNLMTQRSYTDTVGRRLHSSAAEILRLAGWLAFDSGHHPNAQRYWTAAMHAAHAAGDRALGAIILGCMSCQAKDLGQTRQAVTLAETARAGYPAASPKVTAILHLRAAEAHANAESVTDTRRAIDAAFDTLDNAAPDHGDPDWTYWVDEAQAHAMAGYSHLKLSHWAGARTHLRMARRLQGGDYTREGALRNALLGQTYALQEVPDLDKAVALGDQAVVTLSDQVASARCVKHVRTLAEALYPHRAYANVARFCADAREFLHGQNSAT
ncbi:hypothetical protein [Salinispora vitiensis]|uniref:hypothetical protein n=1 Tax=Salinispora vitiensis TaxID=999544 RepID=UPI0003A51796|nr:hypothetical protein [Salinispora vitiensis]